MIEREEIVVTNNYLRVQRLVLIDVTTPPIGHPSLLKEGNGASFNIIAFLYHIIIALAYWHISILSSLFLSSLEN